MKGAVGETLPSRICLYSGCDREQFDLQELRAFLASSVGGCRVELREDFLRLWTACLNEEAEAEAVAGAIARARVKQPHEPTGSKDPLPGEVDYERRFLRAGSEKPGGLLYDGEKLLRTFASLLPADEIGRHACHIVLTEQLVGTWDEHNQRYHARVAVFGVPTIISASGLVEGPAKPKEVYLARQMGLRRAEPASGGRQDCLDYHDPRRQEALKGYLLQAVFYHVTGDPFCEDVSCRLYNAHWQEELIAAQIGPDAGLCERHRNMLEAWT